MIFILFHLIFAIAIFFLTIAFLTGAPFVPSTNKTATSMIELAQITSESVVYDLGSGDGKLLFLAAQKGAKKSVGVEINLLLVVYTWVLIHILKRKNISVRWGNFWRTEINDASVIFVYLLPWKMDALAKKLMAKAKPGTLVVSNSFIFPGWEIVRENKDTHVYVFKL